MPTRLKLRGPPPATDIVVTAGHSAQLHGRRADRIQASEYGNLEGYLKMKYLGKRPNERFPAGFSISAFFLLIFC